MGSPHVLMVFLDGVGIGTADPAINPFFVARGKTLRRCCNNSMIHREDPYRYSGAVSVVPLEATLDVAGLPQSGTGQTALYTGINASKLIGKHFGPYPYSSLRPALHRDNIFRRLIAGGKRPYFANAYPEQYFRYIEKHKSRIGATTLAWLSTRLPLNDHNVLLRGEGISADITNGRWSELGYPDVPVISAYEAGKRLAAITREYDFVLYEYYLTDTAGHHRSMTEAIHTIEMIDEFIDGILSLIDSADTTFVMTSDHGNLEDLSTRSHTRNPVPFFIAGAAHRNIADSVTSLIDVTPALLRFMT
jgi:2,3-bisphosphoglycerate-independent phosphoglycerate mutase